MTTQISPNAALPIPQTGDPSSSGTWGVIQGTGMEMLDGLICAIESVPVGGNTNVVLTFSAGTLDQTDAAHFNLTGVLTGNVVVLWPNGRDRMFSATNQTTGAHTLSLGVNDGTGNPAGTTQTLAPGTTSQFISDGTNIHPRGASGGLSVIARQIFTGNGTYTPSAGMQYCKVQMCGSGAGGCTPTSQITGGGGGGEYAEGTFTAAQIGVSQPVTIGAGGLVNLNGNTTSLGSLLTANGGTAAVNNSPLGGAGGTGGTGTGIHIPGGGGGVALQQSSGGGGGAWVGGSGGASYFGFQNNPSSVAITSTSTIPGNGGTTGFTSNFGSPSFGIGGGGAPGVMIITEFIAT